MRVRHRLLAIPRRGYGVYEGPRPKSIKLATFNVNGVRARLAHLLLWLEREQPDIACLQELNTASEGFPINDLRAAGYDAIWHGQRSWNGVAILTRATTAQGWTDALRSLHPDDRVYTFWDYFRQSWTRNAGLRIDHLSLNAAAAGRLLDGGVDRWVRDLEKPSDHAPAWITLARA